MEQTSKKGLWVLGAIIVVIIGASFLMRGNEEMVDGIPGDEVTEENVVVVEKNRIVVSDQFPGDIVFVSSVTFEEGGWVVIHKNTENGVGEVIGERFFGSGTFPGEIELTEATLEGSQYTAMLHRDNGDREFVLEEDVPIKNSKDEIVMTVFNVTEDLPEQKL